MIKKKEFKPVSQSLQALQPTNYWDRTQNQIFYNAAGVIFIHVIKRIFEESKTTITTAVF